jgi:hypothetical protein
MFLPHAHRDIFQFSALHEMRGCQPSLVPAKLEEVLFAQIVYCQNRCDPLSSRECRERVGQKLSQDGHRVVMDRCWWRRFLRRHAELGVRRRDSRETARASVRRQHIIPYLDAVAEMLSHPFHPDLVINMTETGFVSRPLKGSRKNCVLSRMQPLSLGFWRNRMPIM